MRRLVVILLAVAGLGILVWVLRRAQVARDAESLVGDPPPDETAGGGGVEPAESTGDVASGSRLGRRTAPLVEDRPPAQTLRRGAFTVRW